MEYWQRWDNKRFDTEEEAYQDCLDNEDIDVLKDYLLSWHILDVNTLLHWAMDQGSFWEAFQDEITEARGMMFEDNYCQWIEPDEPDELITEMEQRKSFIPKKQYAVDTWGDLYEINPTE